jgi:hypothetical protein
VINKRIKELHSLACTLDYEHYPNAVPDGERIQQKFAELIIKECIRYFNEDYQRDFNTLWREDLSKSIKEHFGVEE